MRILSLIAAGGMALVTGCFFGSGGGGAGLVPACENLCQCAIEALLVDEAERAACEAMCQADQGGQTAECYSCVIDASCTELFAADACEPECDDGATGTLTAACENQCACGVMNGTVDPADEAACVTDCEVDQAGQTVECFTCVEAATCADIAAGPICVTECGMQFAPVSQMNAQQNTLLGYD